MAKKARPTARQIEAQYDSGENRLTQERMDFLLPQIRDFVQEKRWLNIRPEYQRRLVWDRKKKSRFIESLLMNVPIPPVFLYEVDLNRYEVMDGQQRLNAIMEFYDNTLKLTGLETWSVLNGKTYKACPPRIQRGLDRRRISAAVLLAESVTDAKQAQEVRRQVFERLNTGGQQLNAQELRNSLYSGPFNDLLIELAGNRLFDEIWDIPPYEDHYQPEEKYISQELANNRLFKRMTDCEIVLRFFAFRRTSRIRGAVRKILDQCMLEHMHASSEEIDELRTVFMDCLTTAHSMFKEHTFQIKDERGRWRPSQPLFDAVMVSIERLRARSTDLIKAKKSIGQALADELKKAESYDVIVGRPNTAKAIKERISLVHDIMEQEL